jgi:hypothetical protein
MTYQLQCAFSGLSGLRLADQWLSLILVVSIRIYIFKKTSIELSCGLVNSNFNQ